MWPEKSSSSSSSHGGEASISRLARERRARYYYYYYYSLSSAATALLRVLIRVSASECKESLIFFAFNPALARKRETELVSFYQPFRFSFSLFFTSRLSIAHTLSLCVCVCVWVWVSGVCVWNSIHVFSRRVACDIYAVFFFFFSLSIPCARTHFH